MGIVYDIAYRIVKGGSKLGATRNFCKNFRKAVDNMGVL